MNNITRYVAVLIFSSIIASGRILTLQFSGTYDTTPDVIFGQQGAAVPYSYTITYDTSLNTNEHYFPVGYDLGGYTTTHEWYGYSSSGIIDASLSFGSATWEVADIDPRFPAMGISADLWFDADIELSAPDRAWMFFDFVEGDLHILNIGDGIGDGPHIYLSENRSFVRQSSDDAISSNMDISIIPEPNSFGFIFSSLCGLAFLVRRKRRANA